MKSEEWIVLLGLIKEVANYDLGMFCAVCFFVGWY